MPLLQKRSLAQSGLDTDANQIAKKSTGSPSHQHLAELSLQFQHYNEELLTRLRQDEQKRGKTYAEALANAKQGHDRVRRAAQRAKELNQLQIEKELQEKEHEEAVRLETERQRQLEFDIEERRRRTQEAERLHQLQQQAEFERRQQDEQEQRLRREKEELAKQVKAQQAAQASQSQEIATPAQSKPAADPSHPPKSASPNDTPSTLLRTGSRQLLEEHERFLSLHTWLKQVRKQVTSEAKKDEYAKKNIGHWRREITKSIGQLTRDKNATVGPRKKVAEILNQAKQATSIKVDVRPCFPDGTPEGINESNCQVSGLLIYELNMMAKAIINQWVREAGSKPETADPPGILATYIFALNDFKIQGHTLINILIAKLHKTCPILFGISGNEKTAQGRAKLGWRQERDEKDQKQWVNEQTHHERMTGLGAGFAALSLRDFTKAPMPNPYPNHHYWRAVARIVNTAEPTPSHLIVLKAMIENTTTRFCQFFGLAARVALHAALVELPQRAPQGPARTGLATLPAVLEKKSGLRM